MTAVVAAVVTAVAVATASATAVVATAATASACATTAVQFRAQVRVDVKPVLGKVIPPTPSRLHSRLEILVVNIPDQHRASISKPLGTIKGSLEIPKGTNL